jgi:DNA-binding response OmpR family regulator
MQNNKVLLLLVEDDALLSMTLAEALETAGFEMELAGNGHGALSMLEDKQSSIRGVVSDINLGEGPSGWDIARRARELIPQIPVVYMSGASQQEWTSQGVPNSTFVGKPFAPAQIVTAISALLNNSDAS